MNNLQKTLSEEIATSAVQETLKNYSKEDKLKLIDWAFGVMDEEDLKSNFDVLERCLIRFIVREANKKFHMSELTNGIPEWLDHILGYYKD